MVRSLTVLLITLFVASVFATAQASDGWPMYRGNLERTGVSTSTVPSTSDIKWVYNTTGEVDSSPAVVNGRLIVGESTGKVIALNSTTGAHLWTYETESGQNSIWSSPAIDSGNVYIGTRKNSLLCLDESSGALKWSFPAGGEVDASPAVKDGRVYFATTVRSGDVSWNTEFFCLNGTDGSLIWNYEIRNNRWDFSSPALMGDRLFACNCVSLYALNAINGNLLWNASITTDNTPITSTPVVSENKVYVNAGASITCVNAESGGVLWTKTSIDDQTVGSFRASPAIFGDNLIIASGLGTVFNVNAETGALNWKNKVSSNEIWSSPAIADGKIVVGASDGKIYCLNLNDGTLIWSKYTLERIVSSPTICEGTVYVGCGGAMSGGGRIYAFGAKYTELSSLTLSLDSQTAFLGFKVKLIGTLTRMNGPIVNVPISLSFSINGGESWNDITAVPTGEEGSYEAVWVPSATGTYLVKANWNGEYPLSSAEQIRSLSVTLYNDEYVFSVVSNSTVSALSFNSESQELSFSVSGESSTTGQTEVMIAKTLVPNIADLRVYLDQTNLNYNVAEESDAWILTFSYSHSTHNVRVAFSDPNGGGKPTATSGVAGATGFSFESVLVIAALLVVIVVLVMFVAVLSLRRKH